MKSNLKVPASDTDMTEPFKNIEEVCFLPLNRRK